jgi:protocatechuate 3,4-dioxygenase, alpha subunit
MLKTKILKQTPSQTLGPFSAYSLTPQQSGYAFEQMVFNKDFSVSENKISISGQIFDGERNVINDALIEIWSPEDSSFFGRFGTNIELDGKFFFEINKPKGNNQAPHISVLIFMRGQLIHSYTRIYFEDEEMQNENDEILNLVPENRRQTLIAKKIGEFNYIFDIHMQGENETVFFKA